MKKKFFINGEELEVEVISSSGGVRFVFEGAEYHFSEIPKAISIYNNSIFVNGDKVNFEEKSNRKKSAGALQKVNPHNAPMPGTVLKVFVKVGDALEAGQALLVMEAMKLQLTIEAAYAGTVRQLHCAPGDLVQEGALLVEVEAKS